MDLMKCKMTQKYIKINALNVQGCMQSERKCTAICICKKNIHIVLVFVCDSNIFSCAFRQVNLEAKLRGKDVC